MKQGDEETTAMDPDGNEWPAAMYLRIWGDNYRDEGNDPRCKACDNRMFIACDAHPAIKTHYKHYPRDECPSLSKDPFSRFVQPRKWDPARGKEILRAFCEEETLVKTYNTLKNIATRLSSHEFYLICREADRRRIWRYAGITINAIPYIMAVLRDIRCTKRDNSGAEYEYVVRATMFKPRRTFIDAVWEHPDECRLDLCFVNRDGKPGRNLNLSPVRIYDARVEGGAAGRTDWITRDPKKRYLLESLKRFCKEKGHCHAAEPSSW